ncbi:lysozyme [Sphingosinicella xenopeptidilytica]|uniref:Lysozyme n=1 Tax=Sphingosinicella xenopeptidilytica TaxID=364098 RepID=A0ABW3C3V9_SPHXN
MKIPANVLKWAMAASVPVAVAIVAPWEGKSNDPYRDIVGVRTVCYGETRVEMRRYTDAECLAMLNKAVAEFANQVLQCTPRLQYHPYQLAAAVSLAYNIGVGAYCRSTVDRLFDAGDLKGACDQFARWRMAGGMVVQGLVNRRKAETELCLTGL